MPASALFLSPSLLADRLRGGADKKGFACPAGDGPLGECIDAAAMRGECADDVPAAGSDALDGDRPLIAPDGEGMLPLLLVVPLLCGSS